MKFVLSQVFCLVRSYSCLSFSFRTSMKWSTRKDQTGRVSWLTSQLSTSILRPEHMSVFKWSVTPQLRYSTNPNVASHLIILASNFSANHAISVLANHKANSLSMWIWQDTKGNPVQFNTCLGRIITLQTAVQSLWIFKSDLRKSEELLAVPFATWDLALDVRKKFFTLIHKLSVCGLLSAVPNWNTCKALPLRGVGH